MKLKYEVKVYCLDCNKRLNVFYYTKSISSLNIDVEQCTDCMSCNNRIEVKKVNIEVSN